MGRVLDDDQVARFHRDGFVAVPDFVGPAALAELKGAAERIVDEFVPPERPTVFTTDEQERVSDGDFMRSASGVWCFYETDTTTVNKIGHAMHDLVPEFEKFTYTSDLAGAVGDIGLVDPLVLQSMYIFKQPLVGGEVGCHQDASFLYTDPITVTGCWFAVEDATIENGCMWAAPGGHTTGLRSQFKRAGITDDDGTTFEVLDPTPLPTPPGELVPIEATAGTLVLLHGLLPHWSDVNHSPRSRHAYTVHCISASAEYPAWNWLQRSPDMPLRAL